MSNTSATLRAIEYAFGAAIVASLSVLIVARCVFGFRLAEWTEWRGGTSGIVGTIAGVVGAVVGLKLALRVK
jgi:hypothetical protein